MRNSGAITAIGGLGLLVLCSCSVISPPPMVARHGGTMPSAAGMVELAAVGIAGGGVFLDDYAGGEGRVKLQLDPQWKVGASFGGLATTKRDRDEQFPPDFGYAGRLVGQKNWSDVPWLALDFGLGGGWANSGLRYGTADVGVNFSYTFWEFLTPYGGPIFALSVPFQKGRRIDGDQRPELTTYVGYTAGLALGGKDTFRLSAELLMLHGTTFQGQDGTAIAGSLGFSFPIP